MRHGLVLLALLAMPVAAFGQTAPAETGTVVGAPLPTTEQGIEERLKSFDPAAVTAARHYFDNPAMKRASLTRMKSVLETMSTEMAGMAGKQDKDAAAEAQEEGRKIIAAADAATTQNYDLIIGLQTIAALQTFSKDELIALDNFYSSPTGQAILAKMPDLNMRMPAVMHAVMPKLIAAMTAAIKPDAEKQ